MTDPVTAPAPDEGRWSGLTAVDHRKVETTWARADVNAVACVLMAEWERSEGPVTPSYMATFADMARAVLAAVGPDSTGGQGESVVEWGVRFADGEDEFFMDGRGAATEYIALARGHIAAGDWEADDYEPMTLITRECEWGL